MKTPETKETITSLRFRLYDHYATVFQEQYGRYLEQHQLAIKDYSEHRYAKDLLIEALEASALKALGHRLERLEKTLPSVLETALSGALANQGLELKRMVARLLFFTLCEVGELDVEEAQRVVNLFAPEAVQFRSPDAEY